MNWNPYPPLPIGAVKDLLGITRALYRHTQTEDPKDVVRLQALADVGKMLGRVLGASRAHPGTIDHGVAWSLAEEATKAIGDLVTGDLAPIVATTARCLVRKRQKMA